MIILTGPSASGKTEIAKMLISLFNYQKFVTTTTRQKRVGEIDGKDYYFINKEDFLNKIKEDAFIEYTIYNNNYYGSFKKEKADNKILIVEPNGLKAFQKLNDPHMISFFIDSDEKERYQRMLKRGDEISDINRRINNDRVLFYKDIKTDFIIKNKDKTLEELARQMRVPINVFKKEIARYNRQALGGAKNARRKDYGKCSRVGCTPLIESPFWAYEVGLTVHYTPGGISVNESGEVMRIDGIPVPGLWAAGEVTGSVHGANRLGGNGLTDALTFGRLVGEAAAKMPN